MVKRFVSIEKSGPGHIVTVFNKYREALRKLGRTASGCTVAEVGSGVYNPGSVGLLGLGARKVLLVEPNYFIPDVAKFSAHMQRLCEAVNGSEDGALDPSQIYRVQGGQVVLNGDVVELAAATTTKWLVSSNSVDIVLSNSVLEHVRDVDSVVSEMARCLRPGGIGVHYVHLRDHYFKFPFDMLKYSKFVWERVLTTRKGGGGYQNRARLSQLLRVFGANELRPLSVERTERLDEMLTVKHLFHEDFQSLDDEDLATVDALITLRKGTGART
jgi:SAM-dependent methyltransferase